MTPYTLAPFQSRALSEDRLSLLKEVGICLVAERDWFRKSWPHKPPHAWADNPWCAFTEARKVWLSR